MIPEQLRYHEETATRYSDPPSILELESNTLHLLDQYTALVDLRNAAKVHHQSLIILGVFQSIPTLTKETRKDRPGTFYRAVFMTNSPEVRRGLPRKHYIGNHDDKVQVWREWIHRTRLAIQLNNLIYDIGGQLKDHYRTIARNADSIEMAASTYSVSLENLTP